MENKKAKKKIMTASEMGRKGGKALVEKRGVKYMEKISRLGVEAKRKKNRKK